MVGAGGQIPLCFAQNANVGPLAYDAAPRPVDVPAADAQAGPASVVPLVRSIPALRSAPTMSPLAFATKMGRVVGGPLWQAAVAAALVRIEGIDELLGEIDQSGGFVGFQCAVGPKSANVAATLIFEITPRDPTTGERKQIISLPIAVNLANPRGVGGGSAGYTFSDAEEDAGRKREGFNWAARATATHGDKREVSGAAFGDSVMMDETVSFWREKRAMGFVGENLWRADLVGSMGRFLRPVPRLGALADKTDLKCGGTVMVRSPLLGEVPVIGDAVRSTIDGKNALENRVSNNRADHSDERSFLDFLAKTFIH